MRAVAASGGLILAIVAIALAPVAARAEVTVFEAYNDLTPRLKPAPLVPMAFPAALTPLGEVRVYEGFDAHGHYSLQYSLEIPPKRAGGRATLAGDLLVKNFSTKSLSKQARSGKRQFHESAVLVRGQKGVLLKAKHTTTLGLLWAERGTVYELATGTPKTVSLADLQATAAGMDRLVAQLEGFTPPETGFSARNLSVQARVMLGERSALIEAGWQAGCAEVAGSENAPSGAGQAIVTLPLSSGSVSLPATPVPTESPGPGETAAWTLSAGGSLASTGGQLTEQVSGTANGRSCAVGPATFALAPFHEK